jgi:serine/threonine protein kinase
MKINDEGVTPELSPEDDELAGVLESYLTDLEAGRATDLSQLTAEHPAIAERLRSCLSSLHLVEQTVGHSVLPPFHGAADSKRLGDFRIVREIGRGGMGIVYEAEQISLQRRVALKVLPFGLTTDARQLQRFQHEAQAAAQLHHTNIVPVYVVGCENGVHFYVMQYIEGQTVAELIAQLRREQPKTDSPLRSPGKVAQLGIEAALAMDHAHAVGVIHRDIKPANLLIDNSGKLCITDFGLARIRTESGLTATGNVIGTLRYMSPEQALAKHGVVDHRVDIYALGVTLYELLTLEPVFAGQDREELLRQIAFDEPVPPRRLNPAVPADLETIVLKAMAKLPEERYATAHELAEDLRRFQENRPIQARRPTLLERAAKWSRRYRPLVASAIAVLLVAAVSLAITTILIAREQARTKAAYDAEVAQRARFEKSFRQARQAVDFLSQISEEELADNPELREVRRRLLETALDYYQEFIELAGDEPAIQAELAASHLRVANILNEIGREDEALASFEKAQRIQEFLERSNPAAVVPKPEPLFAPFSGRPRPVSQQRLLTQKSVQEELQLTSDQVQKINQLAEKRPPANFGKHMRFPGPPRSDDALALDQLVADVLKPEQKHRLQQIAMQQLGTFAMGDPQIARGLGLTPEQTDRIRTLRDELRGPAGKAADAPRAERSINDKIMETLTDEQKTKWKEMLGEPFQGEIRLEPPPPPRGPGRPPRR